MATKIHSSIEGAFPVAPQETVGDTEKELTPDPEASPEPNAEVPPEEPDSRVTEKDVESLGDYWLP